MRRAKLRDGGEVAVRPIRASDKELLREGFLRLSPESRFRRFHTPVNDLTASQLRYLTEVDHHDHEALLAFDPQTRQSIGAARFVRDRDRPERAEAAVTVMDDWQRRGVGRVLLEELARRAREERVERFTLLVQADNRKALAMFHRLGAHDVGHQDGEVELELEVPERDGVGAQLAGALRAAAEGAVSWRSLAERVLERAARAPVRYEAGNAIVVGTDGSETAERAVEVATELAETVGAPLHVVRAEAGDPAEALIAAAERERARLIVVGDRGMTGRRRYLLGSVPGKVSHHAPCNVLIVRTSGA